MPSTDAESKKRKRSALDEAADPKLGEFLEVMNPGKKQRDDLAVQDDEHPAEAVPPPATAESDDEYEDLPYRNRKSDGGRSHETGLEAPVWSSPTDKVVILDDDVPLREAPAVAVDASDESWLRSRTNRLLDLVDADDLSLVKQIATVAPPVDHAVNEEVNENQSGAEAAGEDDGAETPAGDQDNDSSVDLISKTARIFVRNLPYTATEDDIHGHFSKFGSVQEVFVSPPVIARPI